MTNLLKMNQIIQLIRDYNSDTSVSPEQTLEGLEMIIDEATMYAEAIKETNEL